MSAGLDSYCPYCDNYIARPLRPHLDECGGLKGRFVAFREGYFEEDRATALDVLAEETRINQHTAGWRRWVDE